MSKGRSNSPSSDNGYRLKNCAEDLYGTITKIRQESKLKIKNFDIPMEYLILAIEYVLRNFGANGENVLWPSNANWIDAVKNSGYIQSEIYQETI